MFQLAALETRQLEINTFVAKSLMTRLNDAARAVMSSPGRLHENDIDVSSRIITQVLQYEARQTGLNLTHTQDRNFIQVTAISDHKLSYLVLFSLTHSRNSY